MGIAGSPRRGGNTDILLEQVISGAAQEKAEVRTFVLSDLCIAPCRHCDGCLNTGRCVVEDDMQLIHNELREADRLVLASPIFFMGVTAQTKAMIDRCQALWVMKYILKLPLSAHIRGERKGLFVSVGATKVPNLFQPAIATVKSFFHTLEITYAGALLFSPIDEKGAIRRHPTALREAFLAGQRLVKDLGER